MTNQSLNSQVKNRCTFECKAQEILRYNTNINKISQLLIYNLNLMANIPPFSINITIQNCMPHQNNFLYKISVSERSDTGS